MKTILIVDNNKIYLPEICEFIKLNGYNVIPCGSYISAKKLINEKRYDLAIVDMKLDDESDDDRTGLEILSLIGKKSPKILISNFKEPDKIVEALKIREDGVLAHDFIYKPDGLIKILDAAKRAINIAEGFNKIEKNDFSDESYVQITKEIVRQKKYGFSIFMVSQLSGIALIILGFLLFYFKFIEIGSLSAIGAIVSNLLSIKFLDSIRKIGADEKQLLREVCVDKRLNTIKLLFKEIDEIDSKKARDDLKAELILTIKDL